jgi:formimidoylglutamase
MKRLVGLSLAVLLLSAVGNVRAVDDFPKSKLEKKYPGIKPVIPLNTGDPSYDLWKTRRDDLTKGREPGPINVQRYGFGAGYQGIPTFFRTPVALVPADLKAGDVDVAFIGAYTDMGGGQRGASRGPAALRASAAEYVGWGAGSMDHMHTLVNPFTDLNIVDYGDAPVDPFSTPRSNEAIREVVREAAAVKKKNGKHVIPFIIGGDHSLTYPNVAAIADVYGKGKVGVIHFDAHYDATYMLGHLATHGTWVKQLIDEGHVPGENYIQVGLRGYYPDKKSFEWMRKQKFRYHTMAEVEKRGWDDVMEDIIKEANDGPEYIYISFDIDAIDPAFMSGTGTPEPGGLTTREAFPLMRRLCAEANVVGVDVVELAPERDPGYTTVHNTNRLVRECLVGLALRKKGIKEKHYLAPLTVDDGRK